MLFEHRRLKDWSPSPGDVFKDNEGDILEIVGVTSDGCEFRWPNLDSSTAQCQSWNWFDDWSYHVLRRGGDRVDKSAARMKTTISRTRSIEITEHEIEQIILAHFELNGGKVIWNPGNATAVLMKTDEETINE